METYEITRTETGLHVEGFPDADKVIALSGPKATRIAHLSLHSHDLQFVKQCLQELNKTPEKSVLRESAWRSAIITFFKCFDGTGRRARLDPKRIYAGNDLALDSFQYFKTLRNKHVVHDENAYTQCLPGAALNKPGVLPKIAKIFTFSFVGVVLDQSNYGNLRLLTEDALKYVVEEYDALAMELTNDLEAESYEALAAREQMQFTAPSLTEISRRRTTP